MDDKHDLYIKHEEIWQRIEDFTEGQDAVKAGRTNYLPMLPSQMYGFDKTGRSLYDVYLQRAVLWPGAAKTLKILSGILNRKQPGITAPQDHIETFTIDGESIYTAAMWASKEFMKKSVCGILIDYPEGASRSYAIKYDARDILDWKYTLIAGKKTLVYVSLVEEWKNGKPQALLKLYLADGIYTAQRVVKDKRGEWVEGELFTPLMRSQTIGYIPFVPMSEKGLSMWVTYPMLTDVVNLNVAHYQNDADYRNALGIAGKPTPCVSGIKIEKGQSELVMGTSQVWQFEEGGQWGFLGLDDSSGINSLRQAAQDLQADMAIAGTRALMSDPNGVEAAETAKIHREGEHGELSTVADIVSEGITMCLSIMAEWEGTSRNVNYQINTDFNPSTISPQLLQTLFTMYASGSISFDTFFYNLQRGEIVQDLKTVEDEQKLIDESKPEIEPLIVDQEENDL